MNELMDEDIIKMANSAKKRIISNTGDYSFEKLRKSGEKLDGKKVKQKSFSVKPRFYLLVGSLALAGILIGTAYSQSRDELIRRKGGKVAIDRYGYETVTMPEGVKEPTAIEIITNITDVLKSGPSKGGR